MSIGVDSIRKITINQNLSTDVYGLIKDEIENAYNIAVNRSTIYNNKRWINHINGLKTKAK
jgi:hypothetical protein